MKQRNWAGSALQPCDAVVTELHAEEVAFAGQDADVPEGEGEALPVPQLEGVQENGLPHAVLHHVPREAAGSRELLEVQRLDLDVVCKEEEQRHCHCRPNFRARLV